MKRLTTLALSLVFLLAPAFAERVYDVDGPVELYIWLTAKPGQEAALEKTYREVFFPAVSSMEGFRSSAMVRKPGTREYTVRLSFMTEELRVKWAKSAPHDKAWPALRSHCEEPKYDGFSVIHPK